MGVFDAIGDRGHEEVVFGSDPASGLKSIIAIHSTALGPALGGTRFFPYGSDDEALEDVLRLAKAMALKAAAAGLDLGGGKAVIIGDSRKMKSERLWRAYGRVVDSLRGRYITAEDVGTDANDMEMIRRETRWVVGVPVEEGGSGDPSPATARGLIAATRAVLRFMHGSEDMSGRTVAVLGVGKVGSDLVRRFIEAGAKVTVADVYPPAIERATQAFKVDVVSAEDIVDVECDVFAPCSMGGTFDETTIPRLRCEAIVGSANNQLSTPEDAERIAERDILYAPDFVVNGGGLINVSEELRGYTAEKAAAHVDKVYDNTMRVLEAARERGVTPNVAAVDLAEERIRDIGNLRLFRRSGDDRN
ncbi:MAG TPA: Glu/Leu/Phe/Val dehydrogenase dimerization domain-containing protein [Acidimicrobiia bacterium]|nr:Glu/Leu/Phe/Val dehydrogenase dimerization domain-containing protein [Acidimicrobiia bacterium]